MYVFSSITSHRFEITKDDAISYEMKGEFAGGIGPLALHSFADGNELKAEVRKICTELVDLHPNALNIVQAHGTWSICDIINPRHKNSCGNVLSCQRGGVDSRGDENLSQLVLVSEQGGQEQVGKD